MKLRQLYQSLNSEERRALAEKAVVDPGYLWQIATRWRQKKPSLGCIQRLAEADHRLTALEMLEEFSSTPVEEVAKRADGSTVAPASEVTNKPAKVRAADHA